VANSDHLRRLKQGVQDWNAWMQADLDRAPDLGGADLRGITLTSVNFYKTNLDNATLDGADMRGSTLTSASLRAASLAYANLTSADLNFADLSDAHLNHAYLIGANINHATLRRTNLRAANLTGAHLHQSDLTGADLSEADLERATLVGTKLKATNLSGCKVYGISAWDVETDPTTVQSRLLITKLTAPQVIVDDLEVAQFMHLLLDHKKLRTILNAVTHRGILLLGRFADGGIGVLNAVADVLRDLNYLPIIFDFDRPDSLNYTETIKTLVGLARFVVVDISGPSVPQELYATVFHFHIPFVPILENGRRPNAMFKDFLEYSHVLGPPVRFDTTAQLVTLLTTRVIEPAESHIQQRQARLKELFG
jgi:hypothetical protein